MSKNNWIRTQKSNKRVEDETRGIIFYAKNKFIDDKDIKLD